MIVKKSIFILVLAAVLFASGCDEKSVSTPLMSSVTEVGTVQEKRAFEDYIASIEEQSAAIKSCVEHNALTQTDLNEKSQELYELWDGALNELWAELKNELPEEEFAKLLDEQRTWITEKENAMEEAGNEFQGGSMYPLIVNSEAAALTEERVYELYDLILGRK